MAKVTAQSRNLFFEKSEPYKEMIKKVFEREKSLLDIIAKDTSGIAYKKLLLAEDMIFAASIYVLINNLSVELLDVKNEDSLNEGRKLLYKAIIYLEEIVTNYVDASYSEYEDKVAQIENTPLEKRYYLIRKLGLAIQLIEDAYGENTKWKWSFVELEGRFAAVAKNMLDMKQASKDFFEPRCSDYDITVYYFRLIKKLLLQSANRYREKYELSTQRIDDFRVAINYLLALKRITTLLAQNDESEELKKQIQVWKDRMEADIKKAKEKK